METKKLLVWIAGEFHEAVQHELVIDETLDVEDQNIETFNNETLS